MLSALFTSVADALISYAIDKLDPAERIKSWLRLDPARLAFKKALARAYSAFARQYPEYTSSLFDQSFLSTEALPELSKLLTRNQHPDPALLAQAWGRSLGAGADFAQAATKPAAYFLERFEAELKAEPALQSIFDSRALESLPKLEAEIQKLSAELQRGLDEALKAAQNYQQAGIHIGGDVKGEGIVIGNNNQLTINKYDYSTNYYYSGDFVSLNEYYIPPDGVFQRVRVDEFVGRDWLTAKVDAFLNDPSRKSGAFLLIGDAGVGKTSFMAHLVKERRYLHLFAEQVPGQAMVQRAMQSLGSQLVTRYQIDPYKDRDTLNALSVFPDFLERILRLAASTLTEGEKIVIVCDALDEAGVFPDHFVFGLPKELPDGVYFILSQRPVNVKLPNFEPLRFDLEAQGEDNLQDIEGYLSAVAKRPEVAGQIRSKEYSEEFFIQTLKEKSQGVWMYLHYIIKEIESGARAPLDLANLPTGLVGYYAEYWDAWRTGKRGKGEEAWDELYAPLMTTLAAAQEAIPVDWLIQWADVTAKPREVTRLLTEHWRAFITEKEVNGQKAYTPYHLSFKDFLTGRVDTDKLPPAQANLVKDLAAQTVDAHERIVNTFEKECNGEWDKLVEKEYPRLHLSAHLASSGRYETLINLLTEGDQEIKWAEARYQKEEIYSGYISDLTYVWRYAEKEKNYALMIRCMLIENSIHSLASNIPPQLLLQLSKTGIWSYPRCLSKIRENSDSRTQTEALSLIAPELPASLLPEALVAAREIKDEDDRASALSTLAPHLNDNLKTQAFVAAREIKDEYDRARALSGLASHFKDDMKLQAITEALVAAREINDELPRYHTLLALVPQLTDELKMQVFVAVCEINDESLRAHALLNLVSHFNDNLKSQAITKALAVAREIKDEFARSQILLALAPQLTNELKALVLAEALATARKIKNDSIRASALSGLAPQLSDEQNALVCAEALAAALENKELNARTKALTSIAPNLNDDLKAQALQAALAAARLSAVRENKDKNTHASALLDLIPHLTNKLKEQMVSYSLTVVREMINDSDRALALLSLAPYLNNKLKEQVLTIVCEIKDESTRARVLPLLAPHLNNKLKEQVLAKVREIKTDYFRARALSGMAPHLAEELQVQVLTQAIAAARKINDEYSRARALSVLVPHLTDEQKNHSLSSVREIMDESARASALADLTPHLNFELKVQAFAIARGIKDKIVCASALSDLIQHLNDDLKTQVLAEALAVVSEIDNEGACAGALSALAPHLTNEQKALALATASEINDEYARACALSGLAPHLNDDMKEQALEEARKIKDESDRAVTLSSLAPHLSIELKAQVIVDAREIKNETYRASILSNLATYLSNGTLKTKVLAEALAAVPKIENESARATVLLDLAPRLDEKLKAQAYVEARKIKDESARARALSYLAPHLTTKLRTQALSDAIVATRKIQSGYTLTYVLSIIVPYLSNELKAQTFEVARGIKNESDRVKAFSALIPYLTDELKAKVLGEAIMTAYEIKGKFDRARALSALAPHLTNDLKAKIFAEAREIEPVYERAQVLLAIAPYMTTEMKKVVLSDLYYLNDNNGNLIAEAFTMWEEIEYKGLKEDLASFINFIAQKNRHKGLEVIRLLTPALVHFRGPGITAELFRAVVDTARWWP